MARTPRLTSNNPRARCDVRVENLGSIVLLRPITVVGQEWLDDNIQDDAQVWGGAIIAEPRYVADVVAGMQRDGLRVVGL